MSVALVNRINALKQTEKAPSSAGYEALSLKAVKSISAEMGVSRREVEIVALENGVVPIRYQRNIGSLGVEGQLALRRAKVAVIGAGGLGGTVIELLARLGIGALVVIDGDTFTEDNLNRQLFSMESDMGKSKVEAAAREVSRINSAVDIEIHRVFIYEQNVDSLIGGCNLAIDALDNIPVRLMLQDAAERLGIPLIHGAIAGFMGELMTIFPEDRGLWSLFDKGEKIPGKGIEVELGTPTVTPAVIAAFQVMEAIKVIAGRGEPIRHKLFYLEMDEGKVSEIKLSEE